MQIKTLRHNCCECGQPIIDTCDIHLLTLVAAIEADGLRYVDLDTSGILIVYDPPTSMFTMYKVSFEWSPEYTDNFTTWTQGIVASTGAPVSFTMTQAFPLCDVHKLDNITDYARSRIASVVRGNKVQQCTT